MRALLRPAYRVAARIRRLYWFAFRPRTFGVKCLIEHNGRWLMIRNSYGRGHWTLPGGKVGRGEDPRTAAMREVHEEVGIDLDDVRAIGDYYTTREHKRDTVYCFVARVASPAHTIDEGEIAEAAWFATSKLPSFRAPSVDRILAMLDRHAAVEARRRQG